jgi:5'-nucleotidase
MSERIPPTILFTNDDGIASPGLWAAVRAFEGLGRLLVVAPKEQQSGAGRSMPVHLNGRIHLYELPFAIAECEAFAVEATPALAVQHGILELAKERPHLVISGINYGENLGNAVTISGTVGAAMEAASLGIPAIALSQQTLRELHHSYSTEVDFSYAASYARRFGQWVLNQGGMPDDASLIKIDLPLDVSADTPWRITTLSRQRVFWPEAPIRERLTDEGRMGYRYDIDPKKAEPDSDVYAVMHDRVVSVTPISMDMTARAAVNRLRFVFGRVTR